MQHHWLKSKLRPSRHWRVQHEDLVDENIPLMTVRVLREMGHDVRDIRGTADEGMTDDALWDVVGREGR
jgi:hypothetical protein